MLEELIKEYRASLRKLRKSKLAPLHRASMISDTEWSINYMETGHIPGTKWTIARWSLCKREIPIDPLSICKYVAGMPAVESSPEWVDELLEKLMATLTTLEKEAYELVRGSGYSFTQAAQLLGCSKGSVQSYIARAEKKIQFAIRKQTISRGVI